MTGIVSHESGDVYARSDLGGLYKRNSDGSWTQQLDFLLPSENNLMGVAGIAIAPDNSDVVYAAAGKSSDKNGDVLKTSDGGKTWVKTGLSKPFGALEGGRINGEPIAVSPYNLQTVYVLTKTDGLYRSYDGGESWQYVDTFAPTLTKTTGFVEFSATDENVIYVNVSGEGVYISADGGESWQLSDGSPKNLRRCAQNSEGTLFCSASDGIYSYNGTWNKLYTFPDNNDTGFGGIDIDPYNEQHIAAVTSTGADGVTGLGNNHIIESYNGGNTFIDRYGACTDFINPTSYFQNKFTSSSSIVFDGKRKGAVYISDWFGIFETQDISSSPVTVYRNSRGIENTLAYSVKAMPGQYKVMAGLADINAFGWKNIDDIPESMSANNSQIGLIQDTTDIDYCESEPDFVVRAGAKHAVGGKKYVGLEVSVDGGASWTAVSIPESFGYNAAAHVAVSAQKGSSGFPTILLSGSSKLYYSKDGGASWQESAGPAAGHGLYIYSSPIASDRVDGDTFYVCSGSTFYVSRDGGESFTEYSPGGLPESTSLVQIEASPYQAGQLLVCLKNQGVYLSEDYGETFTALGDFQSPYNAAIGKGIDNPVYYVYDTADETVGLYKSADGGQSWEKITDGSNNFSSISDMDADKETAGIIYIATLNRGVFEILD